jgi:branched-chain amino acid transport system substrate-binding protein
LYVAVMQKLADGGIRFDNEGSGYGFKTERYLAPEATVVPSTCKMQRP